MGAPRSDAAWLTVRRRESERSDGGFHRGRSAGGSDYHGGSLLLDELNTIESQAGSLSIAPDFLYVKDDFGGNGRGHARRDGGTPCASLSESGFSGFRFAQPALFAITGNPAKTNSEDARRQNPENPDSGKRTANRSAGSRKIPRSDHLIRSSLSPPGNPVSAGAGLAAGRGLPCPCLEWRGTWRLFPLRSSARSFGAFAPAPGCSSARFRRR